MKPTLRRSEVVNLMSCAAWQNDGSEAAAFGSLVHRLVEEYWRAGEFVDVEAILAEPSGVSPERFDEARDLLARYIATHDADHPPDRVEQMITVETEHAFLTGTPDAVYLIGTDCALVTDVKTAWAIGDASFQLRWYAALLALSDPNLTTFHGRADHIRLNDGVVEYGPWSRDELMAWWDGIVAAIPALLEARERAIPTGGAACTYCRLRGSCGSAVAPARDVPASEAEAERMASDLIRVEATADSLKKALRGWCAEREPMVVGGMEIGFLAAREPSFKPTSSPLTIREYLNESGLSGDAVLSLDRSKIGAPLQRQLVSAGLGEMAAGKPEFRMRKSA